MSRRRRGELILAALYLLALSALVLWPLTSRDSGPLWDASAALGYAYSPARELAADIAVNVLAFVPIGFLGARLVRARPAALLVLAAGAAIAVALETLQWLSAWRTASLLDVLSNTTGTAVGFGLGRLLGRDS